MSNDLVDQAQRIIEWLTGLGFLLPVAIFVLVQLFNRDKPGDEQEKGTTERPSPAPSESASRPTTGETKQVPGSMPWGLPTWMGMEGLATSPAPTPAPPGPTSQWGHTFDREEATDGWDQSTDWGDEYTHDSDADDQVLRWGSAFENDAEGEPIRWTSTFDEEGERTEYGWEGATWGGTFPPRSSDPVIHVG